MSLLAQRYAKALFDVAAEKGAVESVRADLGALASAFQSAGFRALITSPETSAARRQDVLRRVLDSIGQGGAHLLTRNLVGVVLERRRAAILPEIPPAFENICLQASGTVVGVVETARPMTPEDLARVEQQAQALVGRNQKVSLTVKENGDLIGGVRIRIGNTLYDGSVATALDELAQKLLQAPL